MLVDTVFPCVDMKVTEDFKFFDDEDTNRKHKYPTVGRLRRWLSHDLTQSTTVLGAPNLCGGYPPGVNRRSGTGIGSGGGSWRNGLPLLTRPNTVRSLVGLWSGQCGSSTVPGAPDFVWTRPSTVCLLVGLRGGSGRVANCPGYPKTCLL